MKRRDIFNKFPNECEEQVKEVVDYFEGLFTEIKDLLDVNSVYDLKNIENAYDLADSIINDLY